MFIISLTYKRPLEEVDMYLAAHVEYLKKEYARGSFFASGRKVPRTGGIIFSAMKNMDELKSILELDPFYSEGVADFEITEFVPSMAAEGFENLKDI